MNLYQIRRLAADLGWTEITHQRNILMVSFMRGRDRVNVYYGKMTVGTIVDHPVRGRTQLFRNKVTWEELEDIFKNPRAHTAKGYYARYPTWQAARTKRRTLTLLEQIAGEDDIRRLSEFYFERIYGHRKLGKLKTWILRKLIYWQFKQKVETQNKNDGTTL